MNEKYQNEIREFEENFREFREKRIVLYGIGRYTATLLSGVKGFHFVGLMDKDPENSGKCFFELPVLSLEETEKQADLVVINTSETYWDIIYQRIENLHIPVYFKNGQKASKKEERQRDNPYASLSFSEVEKLIEDAEIISFDFFDTLFMRCVCNPRDVFRMIDLHVSDEWNYEKSYSEIRSLARKELEDNYRLDELYQRIGNLTGLTEEQLEETKRYEIELEKQILVPRTLWDTFKELVASGREVYIVTDMYLPASFYLEVMEEHGVVFPKERLILSNEKRCSKSEGGLWKYYTEEIVKGGKALHIGDHPKADVEMPRSFGLKSYQAPSVWDILLASSMSTIGSFIQDDYSSAIIALVMSKLFRDPYALSHPAGKLRIDDRKIMGYVVFGPVILCFLQWLLQEAAADGIKKLIFMSRDGYFLSRDYQLLQDLCGDGPESMYIGISRQLAMCASAESEEDIQEYARAPYSGSVKELFEDRFGITISEEDDEGAELQSCMTRYGTEIRENLTRIRTNYLAYLENHQMNAEAAVVDLGFYGNNQRYLNKLTGLRMKGYYFNADLSDGNPNSAIQKMKACFQTDSDPRGEKSEVLKRMIFVESLLTAPHGMVKEVLPDGAFICAKDGKNQVFFAEKEEIHQGIEEFIRDFMTRFSGIRFRIDPGFIDHYYGACMKGGFEFSDEVKHSFYNDNAMMNRIESALFY